MARWRPVVQVVRFAARAAGPGGSRPVSAPLADPTAPSPDAALPPADAVVRLALHALLTSPEAAAAEYAGGSGGAAALGAADAKVCAPFRPVKRKRPNA